MKDFENCTDCKYHDIFFDDYGWDGCWCNNEQAKAVNQHRRSCTYSVLDKKLLKCPFWVKEEQ